MTIIFDGTAGITTPAEVANTSVTTPIVTSTGSLTLKSSGNTAITVDTSQNVGIGTTSPSSYGKLAVVSADSAASIVASGTTGIARIYGYNAGSGGVYIDSANAAQSAFLPLTINSSTSIFATGGTERMRIDSSGRVTKPYQPYFYAYASANFSSGQNSELPYNAILYNIGSHYNTSTYRFTAPVAGVYLFFHRLSTSTNTAYECKIFLNNSTELSRNYWPSGTNTTQNSTVIIYLSAGDYVTAGLYAGSSITWLGSVQQQSAFYGYLLG
jgi:hypothetical protein